MRKPCDPFGETERSGDASLSMIPDKVAVQVSGRCNGVTLAGAHPSGDLRHATAGVRNSFSRIRLGGDLSSERWIRDCNSAAPADALPGWAVEDSNL